MHEQIFLEFSFMIEHALHPLKNCTDSVCFLFNTCALDWGKCCNVISFNKNTQQLNLFNGTQE